MQEVSSGSEWSDIKIWKWEILDLESPLESQLPLMTSTSYHNNVLIHPQI